jgi:hypothetical protein
MALLLDHLPLTILGANLGRKRRMTLASTATIAASPTAASLSAMSSLVLALLSTAKSIGLVVLLLLHMRWERLLHWESNMGNGGYNILVGWFLGRGWLSHGHCSSLVLQNRLVLHSFVECRGNALVDSGN